MDAAQLAQIPDAELEQLAAAAPAPDLATTPDAELEKIAAAAPAPSLTNVSAADLASAAGIDPRDDFEVYNAIEDENEARGFTPTGPSAAGTVWNAVKGMVSDVVGLGSEALRLQGERAVSLATLDPVRYGLAERQRLATGTEIGGKMLANFTTIGEGAVALGKKAAAKVVGWANPELEAAAKLESRRASWEFLREMRDVENVTGNFNRTLETIFPQALRGLGEVPVNQAAARGGAVVLDPTNLVPFAQGANFSVRAPLAGAVRAAQASVRDAALQVAETSARRAVLASGAIAGVEPPKLASVIGQAGQAYEAALAGQTAAQRGYVDVLRRQALELEQLTAKVPLVERVAGAVMDRLGATTAAAGRAASFVAELPDRAAAAVAAGADEAAQRGVADGVRNLAGAFGVLPAAAGTSGRMLSAAGRDLRIVGRLLAEAEGQLPFFRRVAQETGGLTSWGASLVDASGLAPLVTASGRSLARGLEAAPLPGVLGYVQSAGDAEEVVPSAGVGVFLGMAGAGFGQWRRYANPEVVNGRQNADVTRYRGTLLPDQSTWFDKLGREDRVALATYAHAHPDLQIRFSRLGKGVDGFWYLGDDAGVAVVNLDSPRPLRSIVAHEVGHHIAAHGLDAPIQRILMGDEAAGVAGIYTRLTPEGRLVPTDEFVRLRDEYNRKVRATAQRSGQALEARSDADVAREVFAEHAADWLLAKDKAGALRMSRAREGFASDRLLERLARSELVNNVTFLRGLVARLGGVFDQGGRVAGSNLFGALGRSPELTELVSQYHRRAARLRQPETLSDGEGGGISYDAGQIRKNPEILDRLFDASGDVARDAQGRVIKNADGSPRMLTQKEQLEQRRQVAEQIHQWVRENPELAKGLRLEERQAKGGGKEEVLVGTEIPQPLLEQLGRGSPSSAGLNPQQLANLRALSDALKAGRGNAFTFFYQPATKAGPNKRYRSLAGDWRTEAPYAIEISKAGNIVLRTVSREKLVANAQKALQDRKGPAAELWASTGDLLRDVDVYLGNHAAGRPGDTGLGTAKRDAINELFGVRLPSNAGANPLFDQFSRKAGDVVFRSRRLDRINRLTPVDETFRVDYPRVKANLRPGEAGDSAANPAGDPAPSAAAGNRPPAGSSGPQSWAEVKPGMDFNKVKRLIPKAADAVPGFFAKGPEQVVYRRVKDWLTYNPVVNDADGRRIFLANPEGGGDTLLNRAMHLAASKPGGQRSGAPREFSFDKARMVAAIPRTLGDYHAKLEGYGNEMYFRRYADGTLHMVVVNPNRAVTAHGIVDGRLITQFVPEPTVRWENAKLVKVRQSSPPSPAP